MSVWKGLNFKDVWSIILKKFCINEFSRDTIGELIEGCCYERE